jgi:hypothetical protein
VITRLFGKRGFVHALQVKGQRRGGRAEKVLHEGGVAAAALVVVGILRAITFERRVVVAAHLQFPDEGHVAFVANLDRFAEKLELTRQDEPAGFQQAVAQIADIGDHALVEQAVAHLFVQDDIDSSRDGELRAVGGDEFDALQVVGHREDAGGVEDRGMIDGVNAGGPLARGECGEDAGAGAQINHPVPRPDTALDGGPVELHAGRVRQHALLFVEAGEVVAVKVAIVLLHRAANPKKPAHGREQTVAEAAKGEVGHEIPTDAASGSTSLPGVAAECNRKRRMRVGPTVVTSPGRGGCGGESEHGPDLFGQYSL